MFLRVQCITVVAVLVLYFCHADGAVSCASHEDCLSHDSKNVHYKWATMEKEFESWTRQGCHCKDDAHNCQIEVVTKGTNGSGTKFYECVVENNFKPPPPISYPPARGGAVVMLNLNIGGKGGFLSALADLVSKLLAGKQEGDEDSGTGEGKRRTRGADGGDDDKPPQSGQPGWVPAAPPPPPPGHGVVPNEKPPTGKGNAGGPIPGSGERPDKDAVPREPGQLDDRQAPGGVGNKTQNDSLEKAPGKGGVRKEFGPMNGEQDVQEGPRDDQGTGELEQTPELSTNDGEQLKPGHDLTSSDGGNSTEREDAEVDDQDLERDNSAELALSGTVNDRLSMGNDNATDSTGTNEMKSSDTFLSTDVRDLNKTQGNGPLGPSGKGELDEEKGGEKDVLPSDPTDKEGGEKADFPRGIEAATALDKNALSPDKGEQADKGRVDLNGTQGSENNISALGDNSLKPSSNISNSETMSNLPEESVVEAGEGGGRTARRSVVVSESAEHEKSLYSFNSSEQVDEPRPVDDLPGQNPINEEIGRTQNGLGEEADRGGPETNRKVNRPSNQTSTELENVEAAGESEGGNSGVKPEGGGQQKSLGAEAKRVGKEGTRDTIATDVNQNINPSTNQSPEAVGEVETGSPGVGKAGMVPHANVASGISNGIPVGQRGHNNVILNINL